MSDETELKLCEVCDPFPFSSVWMGATVNGCLCRWPKGPENGRGECGDEIWLSPLMFEKGSGCLRDGSRVRPGAVLELAEVDADWIGGSKGGRTCLSAD